MERDLIMVVDDDEAIRTALTDLLQGEGYRVVAAPGGREALAHLSDGELPRLILLDLMMPGTDGWKFRAEQIVNPAIASIPVIVISAVASPERIGDLGVAILTKPLDRRVLLATIKEHCAQGYPQPMPVTSTSPIATSD